MTDALSLFLVFVFGSLAQRFEFFWCLLGHRPCEPSIRLIIPSSIFLVVIQTPVSVVCFPSQTRIQSSVTGLCGADVSRCGVCGADVSMGCSALTNSRLHAVGGTLMPHAWQQMQSISCCSCDTSASPGHFHCHCTSMSYVSLCLSVLDVSILQAGVWWAFVKVARYIA